MSIAGTRTGGFTLLEMVVAIGIFAIIATISYVSLDRFIDTRNLVEERHDKLKSLQTTMTLMGRDMRFMVNRPVRDGHGDPELALLSGDNIALEDGELLRLTTSRPEPGIGLVSRPQRVGWRRRERHPAKSDLECPGPGPGQQGTGKNRA